MSQSTKSRPKRSTRVATGATMLYRGLRVSLVCETGKPNLLTVHEPTQGSQLAIKAGVSAALWRQAGRDLAEKEIAYYERSERNDWPLSSAAKRALACVRAASGDDPEEGGGGGNEEPTKPPPGEEGDTGADAMTQAEAYAAASDADKLSMLADEMERYEWGSDPADDAAISAVGSEIEGVRARIRDAAGLPPEPSYWTDESGLVPPMISAMVSVGGVETCLACVPDTATGRREASAAQLAHYNAWTAKHGEVTA